jgi:hypothetical protein
MAGSKSNSIDFKEPPPELGKLSNEEYRAYLRQLGINGF